MSGVHIPLSFILYKHIYILKKGVTSGLHQYSFFFFFNQFVYAFNIDVHEFVVVKKQKIKESIISIGV